MSQCTLSDLCFFPGKHWRAYDVTVVISTIGKLFCIFKVMHYLLSPIPFISSCKSQSCTRPGVLQIHQL